MNKSKLHNLFSLGVLAGLLLAACTRSGSTAPLPTDTPAVPANGTPGSSLPGTDPTMDAFSTEISGQMTATAVARGAAGGSEASLTPEPTLPPVVVDTPIPAPTVPPPPTAIPQGGCANPYIVQQGDWIYKIARSCSVEPAALIAANPGINADRISPGQKLNMPGAGAPAPAGCTGTHTVVQGDTLFRIAYNCGLTVEELATPNNIVYPYLLHPGDVIKFP